MGWLRDGLIRYAEEILPVLESFRTTSSTMRILVSRGRSFPTRSV